MGLEPTTPCLQTVRLAVAVAPGLRRDGPGSASFGFFWSVYVARLWPGWLDPTLDRNLGGCPSTETRSGHAGRVRGYGAGDEAGAGSRPPRCRLRVRCGRVVEHHRLVVARRRVPLCDGPSAAWPHGMGGSYAASDHVVHVLADHPVRTLNAYDDRFPAKHSRMSVAVRARQ